MVSYGNASGPGAAVQARSSSPRGGSLFLTRPTLFDYAATGEEVQASAARLFEMIEIGRDSGPDRRPDLPLADAAERVPRARNRARPPDRPCLSPELDRGRARPQAGQPKTCGPTLWAPSQIMERAT